MGSVIYINNDGDIVCRAGKVKPVEQVEQVEQETEMNVNELGSVNLRI